MRGWIGVLLAAAVAGQAFAQAKPDPQLATALETVRALSADDMRGRFPGTPESERARAHIAGRLRAAGAKPFGASFEQPFRWTAKAGERSGVNLVGYIEGADKTGPVLVITAHYDHIGVQNGEIYNGADDNASGVAGLLAIADSFAKTPPKHTVVFAALDAEEQGMQGAKAFVAAPPVPLARVALAMNMDMISVSRVNELYAAGGHHRPWLAKRLQAVASKAPLSLKLGHDSPADGPQNDWTFQSDHGAFHTAKVPWVYFGVEDHPAYHKPTDDFANVPQAFFGRALATVVLAARTFDADLAGIARETR